MPVVAGIEQITGTTITVRVIAKCAPNEHLGVQREIRERVKAAFDTNGVKVPVTFPPYGGGPVPDEAADRLGRCQSPQGSRRSWPRAETPCTRRRT